MEYPACFIEISLWIQTNDKIMGRSQLLPFHFYLIHMNLSQIFGPTTRLHDWVMFYVCLLMSVMHVFFFLENASLLCIYIYYFSLLVSFYAYRYIFLDALPSDHEMSCMCFMYIYILVYVTLMLYVFNSFIFVFYSSLITAIPSSCFWFM